MADNGSWDDDAIIHWCLRDACPLGCKNNPRRSKKLVEAHVLTSADSSYNTPLKARWKGMDRANGKALRGQCQHRLWPRALNIVYPATAIEKAHKQLADIVARAAAAAAAADGSAVAAAHGDGAAVKLKFKLKGGQVRQFYDRDPEGLSFKCFSIMNQPLQVYLDACFAAEAAVTKYRSALKTYAADDDLPVSVEALRRKAIAGNFAVLPGKQGSVVVADFSKLLSSFDSAEWGKWDLHTSTKADVCNDSLVVVTDAWKRLVFNLDVPKIQLLEVGTIHEGQLGVAQGIARRLQNQCTLCISCVDPHYTQVWVARLLDPLLAKRAHRAMGDQLAILSPTTIPCERKHLIGQETRPGKRGLAPDPTTLGKITYRASVRAEGKVSSRSRHRPRVGPSRPRRHYSADDLSGTRAA